MSTRRSSGNSGESKDQVKYSRVIGKCPFMGVPKLYAGNDDPSMEV